MASPFLQASVVTQQGNALSHYNYDELSRCMSEFLVSNNWDYNWIRHCNAVYFPGNMYVKMHLQAFAPSFPAEIGDLVAKMRNGYEIHQKTWSGTTSGTFQLTFMDDEKQGIHAWIWDWREKFGDTHNRVAFRTEDTCADSEALMFNSSRIPIRRYTMRKIQLSESGLPNLYTPSFNQEDPTNLGECTPTFQFDDWKLEFLNV